MTRFLTFIFSMVLLGFSINSFSQEEKTVEKRKNNIIKLNVSALAVKNISVQFERGISHRTSIALGIHSLPFGDIPFKSTIKKIIDDTSVNINDLKLGTFGIVPEFRFYPGKKGVFRGLYFGAFFNYNSYKTNLPINYADNTKTGLFKGTVTTYTVGLQIGSQWKLTNALTLDWWILGPNYGSASGKVVFTGPLDYTEQSLLGYEIEQLKKDVPFHLIDTYSVRGDGAVINIKGPWAGIRGGGINLGFRF